MKRTTIHISAALALLLGIAACTQDEAGFLPEGAEGTPIVFTATGLNPDATATAGTRAPVDGDWEGVQSVAVRMDGTVKAYNVTPSTSDNTSAMLTSDDPHYWTNHTDRLVTAWWPYTAGETTPPAVVVKADQSARKDFEGSDLIVAEEQTVSYGNPTLRFTHRTARVTVILTDYTEGMASVKLTGLSTENGNPAQIIPYDKGNDTYTALVAPQSVATGTAFITCAFNNGKSFAYKMKNDTDWQAGKEYTYTVSLAAAEDPGYTYDSNTNTYTVYSAKGLLAWNEAAQSDLSTNCTLTADITLPEVAEGESNWTPVGNYDNQYTGTFDGNGHTITGLTVNQGRTDNVGLIGGLGTGGKVQNVTLTDVSVTGYMNVGGVVGANDKGTVTACTASGDVTGTGNHVGGVVGWNYGTVTACTATGDVSGNRDVGGVAGYNEGSVTGCYATGDVSGNRDVGGVAGWNCSSGTVTACTASGSVSGNEAVGGVVGWNYINGTVTGCYATGDVSGNEDVGGVVGYNTNSSTVTACYHANGTVSGPAGTTGGVVGYNNDTVTACYWSNYAGDGIGNGTGDATKVDGTTVTWQTAVDAMNAALQNAGSEWRYELTGELPTLKK